MALLILNAWGWRGGGGGGEGLIHLLVPSSSCGFVLVSVSLFLVCFLGVVYMLQPVAGWFHTQMCEGSFNSECFLWCVFSYTFLYPAVLEVLFWLAFPSVSLLVCFSGVVYMSQPVAG